MALPACCIPSENASPAELAYCAFNAAADPAGFESRKLGEDRPGPARRWADLPADVQYQWSHAADLVEREYRRRLMELPFSVGDVVRLKSGGPEMVVSDVRGKHVSVTHYNPTTGRIEEAENVLAAVFEPVR